MLADGDKTTNVRLKMHFQTRLSLNNILYWMESSNFIAGGEDMAGARFNGGNKIRDTCNDIGVPV